MSRFFAFGCSLTYYCWPTWADLIASKYGDYYNQAFYGRGNHYIMHSVYETDNLVQFNSTDTVVVMLTSFTRNDSFVDGEWKNRGSVFNPDNAELYTEDWIKNFWSLDQGLMTTWLAARSIRTLLENRGCKFEILLGLPSTIKGLEFCHSTFSADDNPYVRGIYDALTVKESLQEFVEVNYRKKDFYFFQQENFTDVHPTVDMQAAFCRKNLPQYWSRDHDQLAKSMHNMVSPKSHDANWMNPKYKELRGKKLGTAVYARENPLFKKT